MAELLSTRKRDYKVQKVIDTFMDNFFYNETNLFVFPHRTYDKDKQLAGIDVLATYCQENISIDEKAQSHYLLNPLPTFSLELSAYSSSSKTFYEGWFTSPQKTTGYYLFEWCKASKEDDLTIFDIQTVEYALVSRSKLLEYFAKLGLTRQRLLEKVTYIRANNLSGQIEKEYGKGYWFFRSNNLQECPVNLVVRKEILLSIADANGIVRPNEIELERLSSQSTNYLWWLYTYQCSNPFSKSDDQIIKDSCSKTTFCYQVKLSSVRDEWSGYGTYRAIYITRINDNSFTVAPFSSFMYGSTLIKFLDYDPDGYVKTDKIVHSTIDGKVFRSESEFNAFVNGKTFLLSYYVSTINDWGIRSKHRFVTLPDDTSEKARIIRREILKYQILTCRDILFAPLSYLPIKGILPEEWPEWKTKFEEVISRNKELLQRYYNEIV